MIVVDTSIWIDFFRGRTPTVETLSDLLERDEVAMPIPVKIEILSGARRIELGHLDRLLSALPVLHPTDETWKRVEAWVTTGRAVGHRFGFGDLLIAAVAAEHDCAIWSADRDFARLARLGLVTLAAP